MIHERLWLTQNDHPAGTQKSSLKWSPSAEMLIPLYHLLLLVLRWRLHGIKLRLKTAT